MDLERRGRPDLARRFVGRYIAASGDAGVSALLPFYACYRACVRGAVEGMKSAEPEVAPADRAEARARAREYLALAARYAWRTEGPALVACTGLSGTGKSTVAAALAEATGYVLLSSDVLRKRRAGLDPRAPSPPDAAARLYTPAARAAIYAALCNEAAALLAAGHGVIVDATFLRAADRTRLTAVAAQRGCRLVFVECRAPPDVVRARLGARQGSASDARWETYLAQRAAYEPIAADEPHLAIDTDRPLAELRRAAVERLWRWYEYEVGAEAG